MEKSAAATGGSARCCGAFISSNLALLALACGILGLDLYTKAAVADALPHGASVPVFDGFFNLVHVRNVGIAFGLFADSPVWFRTWAIPILALAGVAVVLGVFLQSGRVSGMSRWAFALVLAGASGNLYERWWLGYVTDFLDFFVGVYHWPAFNVADSAITVGVGLLLLDSFRKPELESASPS